MSRFGRNAADVLTSLQKLQKNKVNLAPNSFLNLDQRNTWYIYESSRIPANLVSSLPKIEAKIPAIKYFDIVEKLREYLNSSASELKDFKDLSSESWRYSEQVNQEIKAEKVQSQRDDKGTALADEDVDTVHYWIYSPGDGAFKWEDFYKKGVIGIGWSEIGDLRQYESKNDIKEAMKENVDPNSSNKNATHATWQFVHDMKPGDIVFVKKACINL